MKFIPLERWHGRMTVDRGVSDFNVSYKKAVDLLEYALKQINATKVVVQIALPADKIRDDGLPLSHAQPEHPGVIVSFNSPRGSLSFPCDTFVYWEDNLHAIALTLEALRRVDEYGVTSNNEQYHSWTKYAGGEVRISYPEASKAGDQSKFNKKRMTTAQAAEYIGMAPGTLSAWRTAGMYALPFTKVGGKVFYRQSDLDVWLDNQRRTQTD